MEYAVNTIRLYTTSSTCPRSTAIFKPADALASRLRATHASVYQQIHRHIDQLDLYTATIKPHCNSTTLYLGLHAKISKLSLNITLL